MRCTTWKSQVQHIHLLFWPTKQPPGFCLGKGLGTLLHLSVLQVYRRQHMFHDLCPRHLTFSMYIAIIIIAFDTTLAFIMTLFIGH